MTQAPTVKVVSLPPVCTFFCGMVRSVVANRRGVTISNGHAEYVVQSSNDEGLAHVPVGKRRLVVICRGKIVAVYIRPRMSLIQLLRSDDEPSSSILAKFNPIYQKA
jgi:hypothetical protein